MSLMKAQTVSNGDEIGVKFIKEHDTLEWTLNGNIIVNGEISCVVEPFVFKIWGTNEGDSIKILSFVKN